MAPFLVIVWPSFNCICLPPSIIVPSSITSAPLDSLTLVCMGTTTLLSFSLIILPPLIMTPAVSSGHVISVCTPQRGSAIGTSLATGDDGAPPRHPLNRKANTTVSAAVLHSLARVLKLILPISTCPQEVSFVNPVDVKR